MQKETGSESLKKRISELERQLAEAQAVILAHKANNEQDLHKLQQGFEGHISFSSEEGFKQALLGLPFPLMIWREDGRIMMVNSIFTELSGYSLDDIPVYQEWLRKAFDERVLNQPSIVFYEEFAGEDVKKWREFEITTRSGEKRIWDFNDVILGTDQENKWLILSMAVDITERRQIEEQLEENEQKFSIMFDKAPFAAALASFPNAVFININEEFEHLFGFTRAEVIGKTAIDLEIRPDSEAQVQIMKGLRAHGSARGIESTLPTKYGEHRVLLLNVDIVTISGEKYLLQTAEDITARKQMEAALKEGEQQYRGLARSLNLDRARLDTILKNLPVGVWISDQDGQLIGKNEEADRIWAGNAPLLKSVEEYPQYQAWDPNTGQALKPEDYPLTKTLRTGQTVEPVEIKIHRFDGSEGTVLVSATPIKDDQGLVSGAVSVNVDISERKRVEDAWKASEAKMRAVFRSLTEGVVFLNPNGEVEETNDAVRLTFGHTIQDLSDPERDPRNKIVHPDGTPFPVEEQPGIRALRTGETIRNVELGVPLENGTISWRLVNAQPVLDDQGHLLGAVASFFDITERKQAEQALRESEQRFRSLADSMPQLVWTALPDGRVDYYNRRYQEYQIIRQVSGEDWEWVPVLHPDDLQATVDAWLHSVETGEIYQIEHRVRMKDGFYRWHLSRGIPIRDEQGNILRWFGTATNIHDLKLAEEKLKINASLLERSNRELEQFAFMASHDLQEPLRKIEMFGNLLLERAGSLEERERMYLDRIENAAFRMRDMIEGLLLISRVATQGKPFVPVDLSMVTKDALSDFEDQIERKQAIVNVEPLPTVTGDPSQLRQLMQNLIGNALKYHQPGKPPEIRIHANPFFEKVQIYVEDQGIGFFQEDADRIFEPFQRLVGRSQYEGSGIGLAICRRIVERHGGEIAAISQPGQGTTISVTLPIHLPNNEEDNIRKDDDE